MIGRGSRILANKKRFFQLLIWVIIIIVSGPGERILTGRRFLIRRITIWIVSLATMKSKGAFKHEMPEELRKEFEKSEEVYFDIKETYTESIQNGESSKVVLEKSIAQHAYICIENSEDIYDALSLAKMLGPDIGHRLQMYAQMYQQEHP